MDSWNEAGALDVTTSNASASIGDQELLIFVAKKCVVLSSALLADGQ